MPLRQCAAIGTVLLAALCPWTPARAQGIDCSKARSPTEKGICASPALLSLDRQIAAAYADALAREPERREAMRAGLLRWLKQRDTTCNVPAAAIERCLSGQLTARLAELAPPQPAKPTPTVAAAPAEPAPPQDPVVPSASNPPAPAATLDAASLPAAAEADTLLHVTSPGRFILAAHSPSGAALQLVDMLTGPSDVVGAAGSQDGRLDPLLDVGTYKLRVLSAPGATGAVSLTVTPFQDAAPPAALPAPGRPLSATLQDGTQRAFWLLVPPGDGPNVRIEAAGRALADLRLWRDGRELTALAPDKRDVTPTPGHTLTDLRLVGRVEPGTYLAVAYGGVPVRWTDNSADQPLYVRSGASDALAEGWAGGTVGPFGSEVFTLPASARLLRLDLPAPAPAALLAGDAEADIAKNSREPAASLDVPQGRIPVVELRADAGQSYTLMALERPTARVLQRPGTWWVAAATTGTGGDEVPLAVLLQRSEGQGKPLSIVASTAPRIGPGAWHARFNLRGTTSLLFQTTSGGEIAFSSTGVALTHARSGSASVPADYYLLTLQPQSGAIGSVDVVVGTPGPTPPPLAAPMPPNPVFPLGVQTVAPGQFLQLDSGDAPGATAGLVVRRVPVALAEGPLLATVAAGQALSVPVQLAPGGTLSVSEVGAGPIAFGQQDNAEPGRTTVVVPISGHARTVALAWHRTTQPLAAIPPPPPPGQETAVQTGTPVFFDLRRGEERGFALTVPQGGLFRVETLGRLHTAGRLATPFIPTLGKADANGIADNMLIQSFLRAGRYRVDVRAVGSAGHTGLLANPAPLADGGALLPGATVRATLAAGSGVAFPIEITADGQYHVDALSLGMPWTGRLEDAEGWPVAAPGPLDGLEVALRPGRYRLVVAPDALERRVVAALTRREKAIEITGHGPHPLPFGTPQHATWREPDGRDQPRAPDQWVFSLAGPAEVTLRLGDGMTADLHRDDTDAPATRVIGKWTGVLQAGSYHLDATSIGRNDRLNYTIGLTSPLLQPGAPRSVTLPASVPFSIAEPRVVSLTSWGTTPVKAVLRSGGKVIGRYGARADDWNIAVSRLLPSGQYALELQPATPPDTSPVSAGTNAASSDDDADQSDNDDQTAQTKATMGAGTGPTAAAAPTDSSDDAPQVQLALSLPASLPAVAAPLQAATLTGAGVHVLTLPQPAAGTLVAAQAASAAPLVLALERQGDAGWTTVAIASGRTAAVAAPAGDGAAPWRVEAWLVDGGSDPIRVAARALDAAAQPAGQVSLAAVDGMPASLAVARIALDAPGLVSVGGDAGLAGGWAGHALAPVQGIAVAPGTDFWLVADRPANGVVGKLLFRPGEAVTLMLPAGLAAALPAAAAADGHAAVWRAESGSGQPGLGAAAGVAESSAVALAGSATTLSNATGTEPLRLQLTRLDPALAPTRHADGAMQVVIPPSTALPVVLGNGDKQIDLALAKGVAAFAGWHDPAPLAVWGGAAAVSRTLSGPWTELLLVNTGATAASAGITAQPAPPAAPLQVGTVLKRFYGAAGSVGLAFSAPPGSHLMVAGSGEATAVAASGAVARGTAIPVAGSGRAIVQHQQGAVAVWLDAPGNSPWPTPAPQDISLPARLALSGPAAALSFTAATPMLLHASTTAPVLAALHQGGGGEAPTLFAAGAELHRAVAAGPIQLDLFSADDGPLGGTLQVWGEPVVPLDEGLGMAVAVAPGAAAAFGFTLAKAATIGVGVRAEPDRAVVRLLDASGGVVGDGVAQLRALPAGHYVLEASVPPDAPATVVRPALIGITPRGNGPPQDVVQHYLELVGMKPQGMP